MFVKFSHFFSFLINYFPYICGISKIPLNNKMSGYVRADSFKEKMEQSTK